MAGMCISYQPCGYASVTYPKHFFVYSTRRFSVNIYSCNEVPKLSNQIYSLLAYYQELGQWPLNTTHDIQNKLQALQRNYVGVICKTIKFIFKYLGETLIVAEMGKKFRFFSGTQKLFF